MFSIGVYKFLKLIDNYKKLEMEVVYEGGGSSFAPIFS